MKVGFVSQETQDFLYEVLCRDNTFPWFYQEFTSKYTEGNAEVCKIMGYEEHPYFAHIMAHDGEPKSAAYEGVFKKLWDEIDGGCGGTFANDKFISLINRSKEK